MLGNFLNQVKEKINVLNVKGDPMPFYLSGVKMLEAGNYNAAFQQFKQAAILNPQQPFTFFHLGTACFNLNRFSEAKSFYKKFLRLYSDLDSASTLDIDSKLDINWVHANVYNNLGVISNREEDFIKAIGYYQRAIRAQRDCIEAINNLGDTYFKMGLYDEGIKAYYQALRIEPDNAEAHFGLGLVYVDLKEKEEVLRIVEILKNLNNELADKLLTRVYQP